LVKKKNNRFVAAPLTLHQAVEMSPMPQTPSCGGATLEQDRLERPTGPLAVEIREAIFRTFIWLARQSDGCLTVRQVATVLELSRMGEVDFGATADRIGVPRSALSRIVERLVDSGLVVRRETPADRRRLLLSITAQGVELADGILQSSQEREEAELSPPRMGPPGTIGEASIENGPLLLSGTLSFSTTPTSLRNRRRHHRTR
jgi:DNA-binding MarR family transcriptional regulator